MLKDFLCGIKKLSYYSLPFKTYCEGFVILHNVFEVRKIMIGEIDEFDVFGISWAKQENHINANSFFCSPKLFIEMDNCVRRYRYMKKKS